MHDRLMHGAAPHVRAVAEARRLLAAGGITAFSCDVFDTFLLRRCAEPAGVYERACALAGVAEAGAATAAMFVAQRRSAEARARQAAKAARGSPEVGIGEIYARFPLRPFGLAAGSAAVLAEAEFQAERELCFVNPEICGLLAEARQAGAMVGFISDTYWDEARLAELIAACAPGFGWDFLFASCDRGGGKSETLFDDCLKERRLNPAAALHIGDNPGADVAAPARRGIAAVHYPQADRRLARIFVRETALFDQIALAGKTRLDGGLRNLRRSVAGAAPAADPAFAWGLTVLGPVFAAFDRFVAERVARLRAEGRSVAVACVARDGLLPLLIWRDARAEPVSYIEVNRRTALIAAAESGRMTDFFKRMPAVDLASAAQFLKGVTAPMRRFFAHAPGGVVGGADFAAALPRLVDAATLTRIGREARAALFAHLDAAMPDLAEATDLALIDLGYSGTVQKGLRSAFSLAGRPQRLHGLYLLGVDEDLAEIAEPDSAEGFLSGLALPPAARHAVLANVALLEQMCGAPEGSVMDYGPDGAVRREPDLRPPEQATVAARARDGALAFAAAARAAVARGLPDPLADPTATPWLAAILARALLLPDDTELAAFGGLKHDVNLGTRALVPLAEPQTAETLALAKPLPAAFAARQPPMWMAGSFAALSPALGFLHALAGCGGLCAETFGEAEIGPATAMLFKRGDMQACLPLSVTCTRTGFNELRIRVPLLAKSGIGAVMLPASALPPRGAVRGVVLQYGETAAAAMAAADAESIPVSALRGAGMALDGGILSAQGEDGYLMIPAPEFAAPVAVLTLTIAPLDGLRLLAAGDTPEETGLG
ncbi:hypothetical protein [Oleispirillum naphthae]|uniref:hypothetical protein n=1 Tax=Oleispirillum naphthae TaxID=2838853 RepID=UPI003082240B